LDDPENLQKFWRGIDRAYEAALKRERVERRPVKNPFES
jgi:hypothetical protein